MDILQQMGNPHDYDCDPPEWARCGNCSLCETDGVIGHVSDRAARMWLEASVGICADPLADSPVIVELDTVAEDMPCLGESWEG